MTNGRQSAFPGIFIKSIKIETQPFDEPGVIQEFVGRGITREFEMLQRAADFSEERVGEFINDAEDMIGPFRDNFRIKYDLVIRGVKVPDILKVMNERGISARARLFARVKNPFEPDVIEVSEPQLNEQLSSDEIGSVYDITVTVTK